MTNRGTSKHWLNRTMRIALAALMLSLAFAHKPVAASAYKAEEHLSEEYRLPDGSFAVLCDELHQSDDQTGSHHRLTRDICDACILASSILIPAGDESWIVSDFTSLHNERRDVNQSLVGSINIIKRARSPPLFS